MIGANDQNSKFDVDVAALTAPRPRLKAFSLSLALMQSCFGVAQSGGQTIGTMMAKGIVDFITKHPFQRIAENWIKMRPGASERRYHEMEQVLETLKELGVDPVMVWHNRKKAGPLYATIKESDGYYRKREDPKYRSEVNTVFRLPSKKLEKMFIE